MKKNLLVYLIGILVPFWMQAQIVYENVSLVYPLNFSSASYDLDNNGTTDFEIYFLSSTVRFDGLNGTLFETNGNEDLLAFGEGIQLGNQTYESIGRISTNGGPFPYTDPYTSKYIGLKFKINGVYHCAYLRVAKWDMNGNQAFYFVSYAYEQNAQKCIKTGDLPEPTDVGVFNEEFNEQKVNISPNPFDNIFKISNLNNEVSYQYEIKNVYGETIQTGTIVNKSFYEIAMEHPPGIYFVQLNSSQKKSTFKILKK